MILFFSEPSTIFYYDTWLYNSLAVTVTDVWHQVMSCDNFVIVIYNIILNSNSKFPKLKRE